MKHLSKKFIVLSVICIAGILIFFGYYRATSNIKRIFSDFSKKTFNAEFNIRHIHIRFPLCLSLEDVRMGDTVEIRSIVIYPNFTTSLLNKKNIAININVSEPVIRYKKGDHQEASIAEFIENKRKLFFDDLNLLSFYFSSINIDKGTFLYDDDSKDYLKVTDVEGAFRRPRFYFAKRGDFSFALKGFLENKDDSSLSPIKIRGTLSSINSIEAKLVIEDIRLNTFSSYTKYLSNALKEGSLDFKSDINVIGSDVVANCVLEAKDFVLKKGVAWDAKPPFVATFVVLGSLKDRFLKIRGLQGNLISVLSGSS
ncbi:MAG: hypothetical protein ABIG92_06270 [Candidatus Omnitrophota bacterium]